MKNSLPVTVVLAACIGLFGATAIFYNSPTVAQRTTSVKWEYAVVTGAYFPYTSENATAIVVGAVNICFLENAGCRNEEIRSEVALQTFAQDAKLADPQNLKKYARNRAAEIAFSRTIAKLGNTGWEMTTAPNLRFDKFVINEDGYFGVAEGNYAESLAIYFKRPRP